jgi:hypothetical protein
MNLLDQLLGNGFDDPRSAAVNALAQGLLQGRGAQGLLAANGAFAQAQQDKLKRGLLEAQVEETKAQAQERAMKMRQAEAALLKKDEGAAFFQNLMGGGGYERAAPGQLGSGSFGAQAPAPGQGDMPPRRPGGLSNASPEQIAAAENLYGYKLMDAWKAAKEGFEVKPGTYRQNATTGQREYMTDPTKGMDYRNGRVSVTPGFAEAQSALTLATEGPKALLSAAGNVNLRRNADGTETPVPSLSENPILQQLLGQYFGGGMRGGPPTAPAGSMPSAQAPTRPASATERGMGREVAGMGGNSAQDYSREIAAVERDLASKSLDPSSRQQLTAHLANMKEQAAKIPTQGGPAGAISYGRTTQQEIADAAAKETALKTAGANVTRDTELKGDAKRFSQMRSGLDRAIDLLNYGGPTESGAGAAFDSAAGFFGQSTKGADTAAQLSTLSGWLTANTPRMEGPQSNVDVQQYAIMAGTVGDKTKPVSQRLKAAEEVRALQNKYAELNGYAGKKEGGQDQKAAKPAVVRTGTHNGRKVVQYADGTTDYAD